MIEIEQSPFRILGGQGELSQLQIGVAIGPVHGERFLEGLARATLVARQQEMISVISKGARRLGSEGHRAPVKRFGLGELTLVIERNSEEAQCLGIVRAEFHLTAKFHFRGGEFAALQCCRRFTQAGSKVRRKA